MENYSKKRKWNIYKSLKYKCSDLYFTYSLTKKDIGKYLNTWFDGIRDISKNEKFIISDEKITLKKVDKETSWKLYNKMYNPIIIVIECPTGAKFTYNSNNEELYNMRVKIQSIDDSSYTIWFDKKIFKELEDIRIVIMEYINNQPIINGHELLDFCVTVGANLESKSYD